MHFPCDLSNIQKCNFKECIHLGGSLIAFLPQSKQNFKFHLTHVNKV
jgi:hypothetical protein